MKESKAMAKKEIAFMKKKGGKVSGPYRKAADGIAVKGKTKGKEIKMRMGGSCG